jgi:hypothetical protein
MLWRRPGSILVKRVSVLTDTQHISGNRPSLSAFEASWSSGPDNFHLRALPERCGAVICRLSDKSYLVSS